MGKGGAGNPLVGLYQVTPNICTRLIPASAMTGKTREMVCQKVDK
jgi:hypothetical protein